MNYFGQVKKWIGEITEIALLLIALGISVEILFGSQVPFLSGIVTNLTGMIGTLGENGLVGLVALGVILFLFQKRKAAEQQPQHYNPPQI
ncbi:MAG: hypothetical protein ACYS3N_23120 [Planctomycetota bacterium]|jgi:hypothetical protein